MVQEVEGEVEALLTLGMVHSTFYNFLYYLKKRKNKYNKVISDCHLAEIESTGVLTM